LFSRSAGMSVMVCRAGSSLLRSGLRLLSLGPDQFYPKISVLNTCAPLLRDSQSGFEATPAQLPEPCALQASAGVGDGDLVVGHQALLPRVVLPAAHPGGVLLKAFVRAALTDVADLSEDRTDEGADVGVILAGHWFGVATATLVELRRRKGGP
jgi:hypothetical protein